MGEIIGLVAAVGFWSTVITFIYTYFYTRHRERMAGIDVPPSSPRKFMALRWGLLLIGIGTGVFAGALMERVLHFPEVFTTVFTTCVGGGLALLIYFKRVENVPESETV